MKLYFYIAYTAKKIIFLTLLTHINFLRITWNIFSRNTLWDLQHTSIEANTSRL